MKETYMNKNYQLLFEDPEEKSDQWNDNFFELAETENSDQLTELLLQANQLYIDQYEIYNIIQQLTNNDEVFERKENLLQYLEECELVKQVKIINKNVIIKGINENPDITLSKISDIIPSFKDKELETWNRHEKCHLKYLYR